MAVEIRVPTLPESIADATMLEWHKSPGDVVKRDENLVDIETDKVVLEVPAPADGVLAEIRKHSGDTVVADEVIAVLDTQASAQPEAPAEAAAEQSAAEVPPAATAQAAALSPAVRRLVDEYGLDTAQIKATGPDGRILKEDVLRYFEQQATPELEPAPAAAEPAAAPAAPAGPAATSPAPAPAPVAATAPAPTQPSATAPAPEPEPEPIMAEAGVTKAAVAPLASAQRSERRQPMSRLRRTIARRLVEAQQTAALLTTFNEVDLQAVMALRRQHRDEFEKRYGARLGFMSFFVKASVEALSRFPAVNAYIEGDDIVYHDYYDIGIAVSSPRGLVVPVLRDAHRKSFAEIESDISEFAEKAQQGGLSMDDLSGGTFTITNGGVFGSLVSTPIINPPQSAILGMHKIQDRPVAENGAVVLRPMMYLALSYDHRIIDGREAVQFLVTVKDLLEDPGRLLLQV